MRNSRLQVRTFLNDPSEGPGAYIFAGVGKGPFANRFALMDAAEIEIGDDSHRIRLFFDLDSARARRSSLRKARLLSDTLARFAEALEVEAAQAAELERTRKAAERARTGSTRGRNPWMVHVNAAGRVRGLTEEIIDQLMDELAPSSAALSFHVGRGDVGATITVWALCSDDATFLGAEIFRTALYAVGIQWTGEIKAELGEEY